ncbi:MAG TPA: GNAT family N-acetyltransferase [Phycisphaerae bacterium]|nr:GNAT family N-acetyltransferase [Phycisphaerae bacterium]
MLDLKSFAAQARVTDGVYGTELQKKGLLTPGACAEFLNADNPAAVEAVAQSYVQAGSDVIMTNACGETEWEHSGIQFGRPPICGRFEGDTLVAAASYEVWGQRIAHIGVVTHPQHRGKGFGKSVVAAISKCALATRLILQYRTLADNAPSMAIARSFGFQPYARTISVGVGATDGMPDEPTN